MLLAVFFLLAELGTQCARAFPCNGRSPAACLLTLTQGLLPVSTLSGETTVMVIHFLYTLVQFLLSWGKVVSDLHH